MLQSMGSRTVINELGTEQEQSILRLHKLRTLKANLCRNKSQARFQNTVEGEFIAG